MEKLLASEISVFSGKNIDNLTMTKREVITESTFFYDIITILVNCDSANALNFPHETRIGEFILQKLLLTIIEFIKYTRRVEIILILISLITKGVEVQKRKINYSARILLE